MTETNKQVDRRDQVIQSLQKTNQMHEHRAAASSEVIGEVTRMNIEIRAAFKLSENNVALLNGQIAVLQKQLEETAKLKEENTVLKADVERLNRVVAVFDRKLGTLMPSDQNVGDESDATALPGVNAFLNDGDNMEQPAPLKVVENK